MANGFSYVFNLAIPELTMCICFNVPFSHEIWVNNYWNMSEWLLKYDWMVTEIWLNGYWKMTEWLLHMIEWHFYTIQSPFTTFQITFSWLNSRASFWEGCCHDFLRLSERWAFEDVTDDQWHNDDNLYK